MVVARSWLLGTALLGLVSCSKNNSEAPAPAPKLTPQAVPTAAADGTKLTAGKWSVGETAGGASAVYGLEGAQPELVMACDRSTKTVSLKRPGGKPETWRLEAGGAKADLIVSAADDNTAAVAIDITQPIFVTWGNPDTLVSITGPSGLALSLPGYVGVNRVIAACS
jgi:hypothetical protein